MNLDQLIAGLSLHKVSRFQTYLLNQPKSVAEHSARVAMLYAFLGGKEILPALMHDSEEAITSDIPGPIKKDLIGLEKYTEEYRIPFKDPAEKELCKLADILELVLDLLEQQQLGNQNPKLMDVYEETLSDVIERAKKLGKKGEVNKILRKTRRG